MIRLFGDFYRYGFFPDDAFPDGFDRDFSFSRRNFMNRGREKIRSCLSLISFLGGFNGTFAAVDCLGFGGNSWLFGG